MKRCPQCNRGETDEALLFCRVDGTPLVRASDAVGEDEGTISFDSSPPPGETKTRILPTGDTHTRATAPTTVLERLRSSRDMREPSKPKARRAVWVALATVILIALAASTYFYLSRRGAGAAKSSIAVLPFQNAGGSADTEYLSDGIAESLINSLSQIQQLRVIARATAFSFKGRDADPQAIGRELSVGAVLTGRVRQAGDRLNVQVDLVDASTGAQLWGEEYERQISDLLSIKQMITREVTEKLRLKLSGEQQQQLIRRDTTNAEAYQSYLRGRYHWNKRTTEGLKKAVEEYEQAIERDPTYALAYAALAETYSIFPSYSAGPPVESYSKARAAALRALEIDPTLAEAHVALAGAALDLDWNLSKSNREYERALGLNPNYATAHHWYGEINLLIMNRPEEAIAHLKKAQELDPLSLIINADLGEVYINARQYDNAVQQLKKTIAIEPNFHVSHMNLGIAYTFKGDYEQAVNELQKARQLNEDPRVLARLGYVYGLMGKKAEGFEMLKVLREKSKQQYISPFRFALIYIGVGDKDKAFAELEKGYQDHSPECEYLTYEPAYDSIRSDQRFTDLVKKVGLQK